MKFTLKLDMVAEEKTMAERHWSAYEKEAYLYHKAPVGLKIVREVRKQSGLPDFPLCNIPETVANNKDGFKVEVPECIAEKSGLFEHENTVTVVCSRDVLDTYLCVKANFHTSKDGSVSVYGIEFEVNADNFLEDWEFEDYPVEWKAFAHD